MESISAGRQVLRFGAFEFDAKEGLLRKRGLRLRIQPQPLKVLQALLEPPGRLVSRDELREKLWPTDTFVDFEHGLNTAVTRLRQILGDSADNPRFIETEARLGYRMIAPVQLGFMNGESGGRLRGASNSGDWGRGCDVPVLPAGDQLGHFGCAAEEENLVTAGQLAKQPFYRRDPTVWIMGAVAIVLGIGASVWWARHEALARGASAELAYRRGIALIRERTLPKVREGTDELRRAVQENPKFAQSWAGLAESAMLLDPSGADTAIEYARRAVELDPECGECHGILGFLLFSTKWKWDEAGEHLAKGAALKPNDPKIQISLAEREAALGRIAHAVEILNRAARQFPYSLNIGAVRAQFLYYGRDYQGAIRESDRLTAMNLSGGLEWKSNALFQIGRNVEAVYALHGFLGSWSSASPETIANRKNAAVTRFEKSGLQGVLGDLLKLTESPPASRVHSYNRARWLMLLGKREQSIKELQVALNNGITEVIYLNVEPVFDPIRSHPELLRILKTIGLSR